MDAVTLLRADHDRVRELFRRYRGGGGLTGLVRRVTGTVEAREQRSALRKICDELDVHALVEEEIFYPAVRATGDPELGKQVEEGLREHATIKDRVAALRGRDAEAPDLADEVDELERSVEHHATEEEREMFPRVEAAIPAPRRAELAREIRARKKSAGASSPASARAAARRGRGKRRRTTARARARTAKKAAKAPRRARSARGKRARGRARRRA